MGCKKTPKLCRNPRRNIGRENALAFEYLEPRLALAAIEWFDLSGWAFSAVSGNGQSFTNVVDGVDIEVTFDSGTFDECTTGCNALGNGILKLKQKNAIGALNFSANSRQQYVVEMRIVDTAEKIGVFTLQLQNFHLFNGAFVQMAWEFQLFRYVCTS